MKKINIKIDWKIVKKILNYVICGMLVVLLFLAGMSAGLGNWAYSLMAVCFVAVSCLCMYYKFKYDKMKEKYDKIVTLSAKDVIENRIMKLHLKYYEDNYGEIGKDPKRIEKENQKKNEEQTPACSAENNDQINYHNIAEEVGGENH